MDVSPAPEVGQAVRVRSRLAMVRAVEPYESRDEQGRLHLVEVEYLDDCHHPESDQLLWEVEASASVLGKTSLPRVDEDRPDSPSALRAFVNAHRWTRLNRLRESERIEDEPLMGVWNSAIQVHHYQLDPVLKALEMPRVSLLLADGVGLGKTIEAGLVLEELLLRRRIRRVLVVCPAMLQRQWKYELRRKFNLDFKVIDSDSTFQLRRRLGIDTNPWKAFPRIITSMDYLRMPDILQQFQQASTGPETHGNGSSPHAVWDLLIVDEAHHFAPQSGSRATQRTKMLREIRFLFEHRIFATATPHNGKTVCFTGLLELLDPVRFQMRVDMKPDDRQRLKEIRVRRLKDHINRQSLRPLFSEQLPPVEIPVRLSQKEKALYDAVREYRKRGRQLLAQGLSTSEQWLGHFIFSLLTKRLLSCPFAFARTWWRHLEESQETERASLFDMARVSAEKAEEAVKSDDERAASEEDAARYGGAWLRSRQEQEIATLQQAISRALEALGYDRKTVEDEDKVSYLAKLADSKTEALVAWVKENLFDAEGLRADERLIVFTEYKETLLLLKERFDREGFDESTMRLLFGGLPAEKFEQIKSDFEDPSAAVRLLLATDAASEGINMQESCRWIFHYDVPWSPSKLLQRNGRVARHGQLRDVSVHYFRCDQDEDLDFLRRVAGKVEQIREDLGSVERVFDAAIQSHFLRGRAVADEQLSLEIERERSQSPEQEDVGSTSEQEIGQRVSRARELLESTDQRLGISPQALVELLKAAMAVEGQGALEEIEGHRGFYRLRPPERWKSLVRQTLAVGAGTDRMELVFDAALVEQEHSGRRLLRLKKHQALMRLGHPVMRQAMATLCRQLHDPSSQDPVYRWSAAALHKSNFEPVLIFHYTVTAINKLREPLHDEVRSAVFRMEGDRLTPVRESFAEEVLNSRLLPILSPQRRDDLIRTLRGKWFSHRSELEAFTDDRQATLLDVLQRRAATVLKREEESATSSYNHRLKELQEGSREKEIQKLAKSLVEVRRQADQRLLFEELRQDAQLRVREMEDQIEVLKRDVERTRQMLIRERDQRLKKLLPGRFNIHEVRVLPLAVQYVVPATAEDLPA